MRSIAGALPLALLWGLPLLLSLMMLVPAAVGGEAWLTLLAHPQLLPALVLSLFTGAASPGFMAVRAGAGSSPPRRRGWPCRIWPSPSDLDF
jgi:hypothetical protein